MMRRFVIAALAATVAALLTASEARAWGGFHVGYTHFGAGGVEHYGRTVGVGPYGAFSTGHAGYYGAGGAYRTGYGYGERYGVGSGSYHYGTADYGYGGYHYGGFGATDLYGGYRAGVYRAW